MYGKMMVPVFTASLVPSKEHSKNELPDGERALENQKTLKKFEICYGKPILESFCATRQTNSKTQKSRSISLICFKSYIRCLKSIVSKSPDAKYSRPRSRSLCCVLEKSPSHSRQVSSSASAFTYTVAGSKSVSSRVGSNSPQTYSVYSESSSRSTSYDSSSHSSLSPRSRSPASTCSRSRNHHTRSPVSNPTRRSPSSSPNSIRSCLKSPETQSRCSKAPVSKSSFLRAAALTAAQHSRSSPPRPSCLKQSPSKHYSIRSPIPKKSCLRSPVSKSPDTKSPQLRPPCLKNPSAYTHSNQSACKPSCLRPQVVTFSKSSNSKSQVPRLSRLESSHSKYPRIHSDLKSPTPKSPQLSNSKKSPQNKLPCPKATPSKSNYTTQSRFPASKLSPAKSSASSKTPSYKTANSRSNQSCCPQSPPRSKSPCGRLVDSIRSRFYSPPPRGTVPTLDVSRFPFSKSAYSRDSRVIESSRVYSKPEAKRPKLTVSKIHVKSRLLQGLRSHDGRQKSRCTLGFYDYRRTDQELKYKMSRHINKDSNRVYLEKSLATKMDVRYITELKNYFDKIRGTMTCDPPECPALQERFRKHRMDHHNGQAEGKVTGSEAQTKITLANLGGFTISLERRPTSTSNFIPDKPYDMNGVNGPNDPNGLNGLNAPIQSSLDALTNRYKNDINDELRRWIKKVPTREETPEDEQRKKNMVQNFINRINAMDLTKRDSETEFRLREEIDNYLESVNMWYPGANSDRRAFKDGLRENLVERLMHQNDKFLENARNIGDNIRNGHMVNNSTQNYPNNGPQNYANNGTQPYGMYGTQPYGNKGTQNYVYNGSQPFGNYGPPNYEKYGMQRYANDGVPLNSQPNSNQPYQNMYTGTSTNAGGEGPYNGTKSFGNYLPQNYDGTQRPVNTQSNSTKPFDNAYTRSINISNGAQTGVPQNTDNNLYSDSNTNSANKGPVNIFIDKYGNLASYGQVGTPSFGFNKANPNGMQNHSNFSYNTIDPSLSPTLNTNQNNDIGRNDNPSIFSNVSRIPSKNLNQIIPKPSIRISDHPNYENSGYTPDITGQPRRPSLKSTSYTNYQNDDKDPTSRLGLEPTTRKDGLSTPTTGLTPHIIDPKDLRVLNYPNISSSSVNKQQKVTDNRPLRCTTYDSSYGNVGENDEYIETCRNYSKNKLHSYSCSEPNVKCTVKSKSICICPNPDEIIKKQNACCGVRQIDLETEIADWLKKCTFVRYDGLMHKQEIIDALLLQITPYLSQPSYSLNKAVLKAKIMNVLRRLGVCAKTNCGMRNMLFRLAEELANRLIGIVSRLECSGTSNWKCSLLKNRPFRYIEQVHVGPNEVNREDLKHDLLQEFEYSVHGTQIENNREILESIAELVIDRIELIRRNADETVRIDIKKILEDTNLLNEEEITNIVNSIMKYTREICMMISSTNNRTNTTIIARPCISFLSVYTSEHEVTPNFEAAAGSSTPRKKKSLSRLSPEENAYTDKIATVVRDWLNTVPDYFKNLENNSMNEVMILDLAGSIADHAKLSQLIFQEMDTKQFITVYICKWLLKFEIIDEISRAEPYIPALVTKLQEIEIPKMTRSQHGTRQAMKNIQYKESEETKNAWIDFFMPEGQDILEDEISIWMNEYPSQIYVNKDKSIQNKLVHEIAGNIQKYKKDDDEPISNEIKTWLQKIVKPQDKEMIEMMSNSLRDRIINLPQDKTIAARLKERIENIRNVNETDLSMESPEIVQEESDKTMKEFIIKYVEINFDEDDPLAKRAYAKLLRHELQRLDPKALRQVYEGELIERFCPQKLYRELGYVKDISDWLKTLPIDENFNKVGNIQRVEFCMFLAKEISNIDQERNQQAMNYDQYIGEMIAQYLNQLPLKLKTPDITEIVHSLCRKIFARKTEVPPISNQQMWSNIADFLDDYINLNGQDIANDEVKLEVWAARLLKEMKKMILENPSSLPAADVKERLAYITKPGDETIKRFNHELDYAKEIADWLKNLPLVNLVNEEVIRDLAEKMAEYENNGDDNILVLYINQWISQLPLDKSKQIDVPFAIYQLLNRRKKVNEVKPVKSLTLDQSIKQKSTGTSSNTINSGAKTECRGCCPVDDPGAVIIQVIKEWCDNLPFTGTEEDIKNEKNDIASKLFQKIIEINDNPRMARNDLIYVETLSDKVDELLEHIPNNLKLERNKDQLKTELLDKVKQARSFYKDITLGDEYMKDLEDAIEAVLPNQNPNAEVSPGFEAYKENVAEMFILENFDHGNDADKLKYEQIMKKEVSKFSAFAQQRSVIPIEEERLNNDIKSTLFDVNMPDEKAVVDNVEEIKTKCEIQNWFEKLPLRPITGEAELLERDLKVSLLARKLHILEFEEDADQKIHKEITKWLAKLPLSRGQDVDINTFADDLQEILKSTRESRKCVKASDVDIGKSGILSGSSTDQDTENSIWVNPNLTTQSKNNILQPPRLKSGNILIDIVEKWSDNIPLPPLSIDQLQIIIGDLRTRLYKKISELNSTNIFDDDQMYNLLMGEEIAQALAALPQSDALMQSQYALQYQLISAIESIKPLIREERALQEYKKTVENTVSSILGHPENPTTEEKQLLSKIQEEVVNDFIEYKYNIDDDQGKQFYKNKMVDALTEYNSIGEKEENRNEIVSDTLVEANKLICELDKIPPPDEPALKEEVEEIRMKREVDNFLNNVAPADQVSSNIHRDSLRNSLAKQLHELEKTGHSVDTDQKMEAAVNRTLKKLDAGTKSNEAKTFIDKLKQTEGIRRPGYRDSPSRALRLLMQDHFPRHDSASLDPQGIQLQVDASVYQPDFIPATWKPPTPPPPDYTNLDLLEVMPRQSLPPSPGPIRSGSIRHTITQPTQTSTRMSGLTQTSGSPHVTQRSIRPQSPRQYQPEPRISIPGQGSPQYDPRLISGQYVPRFIPGQSQMDPRFVPGQGQMGSRLVPGQGQMGSRFVPGQGKVDPRLVPGQGQLDPRLIPGQGQLDPRLIPGKVPFDARLPGHFVPLLSSTARIDSEVELIEDECLCDLCKSRCPYFDYGSCEDFFPMNPMMFRRPCPMMPGHPMMPMPYPSMIMPPPAFMYC